MRRLVFTSVRVSAMSSLTWFPRHCASPTEPIACPDPVVTNLCCSGQEPLECRAAKTIANILDHDPASAMRILEKLSPDRRRYLLVAATASEWYGPTQVSAEVDKADVDGDQRISPNEYLSFIEQSVGAKQAIPWRTLLLVALQAGAPFVAFGFLDNSLMILSGDAIDNAFGERLALSAMGAAALGGICSGTLGVQFHGVAERLIQSLGLIPSPRLSRSQMKRREVFRAGVFGGTVGISVGLCLGMLPLLFIK